MKTMALLLAALALVGSLAGCAKRPDVALSAALMRESERLHLLSPCPILLSGPCMLIHLSGPTPEECVCFLSH
jgi:hypothetical protein